MSTEQSTSQYLTFTVGDELFAMDIRCVREIIQHVAMTVVPLMPGFVRGVINLRGAVVPVIDLNLRFGRTTTVVAKKTCIVIFDGTSEGEKVELGLMVDSVSEVIDIESSNIEAPPLFGTTISRDFIQGIGKVAGDFITILEAHRTLNIDDLATLVQAERDS